MSMALRVKKMAVRVCYTLFEVMGVQEQTNAAVEAMRRYIVAHLREDILPEDVTQAAGYSERHGSRLFRQATGKSIGEYVRLLRLSEAAETLIHGPDSVLDVALSSRYASHEGFTKAFASAFGISPMAYRKGGRPIPYFIPYPIGANETMFTRKDDHMQTIITATISQVPARRLVVLYSGGAEDYWSFCQEKGCDWEGLLRSIPERLDLPAFLSLPAAMIPAGCAPGAVGVEVPPDWAGAVPAGYALIDMPAGHRIYFQSQPYEDEDAFAQAITAVFQAYETYDPAPYGYAFDTQARPVFNFGAFAETGARIAVPVKAI